MLGLKELIEFVYDKGKSWTVVNVYESGVYTWNAKPIKIPIFEKILDSLLKEEYEQKIEEYEYLLRLHDLKKSIGYKNLTPEELEKNKPLMPDVPKNLKSLKKKEASVYAEYLRYAYKKNNLPFDDQIRIIKQKHGETLDDVVLNNILSKKLPIKNQKFDPSFDSKYEEWSVSILGKKPLHPTRFRTNIPYGTYFHFPSLLGFNKVVKMPTSLQSKELKLLTVLAKYDSDAETQKEILDKLNKENKPEYLIPENNTKNLNEKYKNFCSVGIGIAVMYSIENVTKSYRKLYELESVYQSYALTVLSNMSRGKNLGDFYTKSFISELEINLYETLNDIPRKQWGIHTYRVGFNRIGIHKMNMTLQELSSDGLYVNLSNTPANKNDVDE